MAQEKNKNVDKKNVAKKNVDKKKNAKKKVVTNKKMVSKENEMKKAESKQEKVVEKKVVPKTLDVRPVESAISKEVENTNKNDNDVMVGLNRESQKNYRTLTKAVAILSLLGKILTVIAIPLILIAAIFFIVIIGKINYNEDRLYFDNKEVAVFEETDEGLVLRISAAIEGKNITIRDNIILKEVQSLLKSVSKNLIVTIIVFTMLFYEISLIIWVFIYRKLEYLFNSLHDGDTPFTEKNTTTIKNIANLMIISTIVMAVGSGIIELLASTNLSFNSGMISIIGILIVYTIYYIFKYGTKMQSKVNMVISFKK